ncbi:MAG: acyl-CoA dehydrogenase family protein [Vicinamibacterales bacterium]
MDFIQTLLSPAERDLVPWIERLCASRLEAIEDAAGESDLLNREMLAALAEEGVLDFVVPGRYGTGRSPIPAPDAMSLTAVCLIRETLARRCSMAELLFVMQGLGAGPITFGGTDDQRARYLPRVARGELAAAFALTEPNAGSDVAAMETTARSVDGGYVLDGRKTLISMAPDADLYTVFAKTAPDAGAKGVTAFIVERGAAGFDPGPRIPLLAPHPIGEPSFVACAVPVSNRLGDEHAGFKVAMATLDFFRTTVGACAVGFAQRALDESIAFAKRKRSGGKTIAEHQAVQLMLAAMATDTAAARLLVYRSAFMRDRATKPRLTLESSQAKLFATEAAQRVIDRAVQIHGGRGVVRGVPVERLYREIRALRIYEGTSEIQHLIIAGQLLRS